MILPIRTRLTIVSGVVFCLSATLLEAGAYVGLNAAIQAIADRELRARLVGVEEFLDQHIARFSPDGMQEEVATHKALEPEYLQVRDSQGRFVYQGGFMRQFSRAAASPVPVLSTVESTRGPLRLLQVQRTIKQREYALHLATDLTVPSEILRRFGLGLLLVSPFVLAVASAVGYWISGRALAPVAEIASAARSIGAADLSRRVAVPSSRDELQYLAETLNSMLARIEDAFRHVSQFTANASHELRTPVAVIRATAEVALLKAAGNADSYREALHRILGEAETSTHLLDDMLRLAQSDSGARALRMQRVDLRENIRQACERITLLAQEKGVQLKIALPEEAIYVSADADSLRRLWLILLDNAVKYTPGGQGIGVKMYRRQCEQAICEVRDSGIGIADKDLPYIFERFFRADRTRARREEGAGLGLAIARWIAGSHGASIEVESALGVGSTFRVIFPHVIGLRRDAGPPPKPKADQS